MRDEFAGLFVIIDCSQSLVFLLSIAQEMQSGSKDGVSLLVQQYRAQRSAVVKEEGKVKAPPAALRMKQIMMGMFVQMLTTDVVMISIVQQRD